MNEKTQEISNLFSCLCCDYNTCVKKDYDKHLTTLKHKNRTVLEHFRTEKSQNTEDSADKKYVCNYCEKEYGARNSLWYHKKKCPKISELQNMNFKDKDFTTTESREDMKLLTTLVIDVVKQNQELTRQNNEFQKQMFDFMKNCNNNISNTNTSNSHNTNMNNSHNKFNLQFFLNETCKDAMNIMDFVNSIQLQLSDLENVGKMGYIDGISNIIVKNLKALDVTQRPMHCSDLKRETMYVKDEDKWEKEDDDNKKLKRVIKCVANKNFQMIPEWKKKHPDCVYSDSKTSDEYNKMLIESVGGTLDTTLNETKIIKKIAKEVTIQK
jgi:hypothetical protein